MKPLTSPPGPALHFAAGSALLERALLLLAAGPQPTAALAARLLGLQGNAGAAAGVVFSLLGADARFKVDAAGVWSLAAEPELPRGALLEEDWVVVDVETTGGSPNGGHRVTEVAAVHVSGGVVRQVHSTLVNPERRIPRMITELTGISDAMVARAPRFPEVAPQVAEWMQGRIFVAHNAAFDWRFVSAELERCTGRAPAGRQLCTVRLARRLLPTLPSRSLDALAVYFGLQIESRHRAADDALATAHLLLRLLEMLDERNVRSWAELEAFFSGRKVRRKRQAAPRPMDAA